MIVMVSQTVSGFGSKSSYRVFNDVASQIVDQLLAITGLRDKKANQIILVFILTGSPVVF